MEISDLTKRFSDSYENQCKAIFASVFIVGNRLQTIFDNNIPEISLKQFMLLIMIRQSEEPLTFTRLGKLLGCSRQNIKKLAASLEKKGFVVLKKSEKDVRAVNICPTEKMEDYFEEVFSAYQKDLQYLFEVYSQEEVKQLFRLMMKLYDGTENLERRIKDDE